jgi:AraC-like DNA-binding protein
MFSTLYVPLLSSLVVDEHFDAAIGEVMEGNLVAAATRAGRQAERWLEQSCESASLAAVLQLNADLQTVRGAAEDAEVGYRLAQKRLDAPKPELRALSCRNAGLQALLRYRVGVALQCFSRVTDEMDIGIARRLEAHCAVAFSLTEMGDIGEAMSAMEELGQMVGAEHVDVRRSDAWHELIATLNFDLQVQRELRGSARLEDHAYWKPAFQDDTTVTQAEATARAHRCEQAVGAVKMPLLTQRVDYLRALRQVMGGDRESLVDISDHLDWARRNGMADYVRTTRIETALSLIVIELYDVAERVLEPLHGSHRLGSGSTRDLDYLYCVARIAQANGRSQEALDHYKRHALSAGRALRQNAAASVAFAGRHARKPAQLDDVGARLPARYRRAYAYMQAHLDREDLSVRELSAEIGVTERALQIAFKTFLGLSPTEVIRRERMERIRADLLNTDRGVLDTANKWGVRSRSALVSGYRKQFNEVPSETLER